MLKCCASGRVDDDFSELKSVLQQYLHIPDIVYWIKTVLAEQWDKAPNNATTVFVECNRSGLFKAIALRTDRHIPVFKGGVCICEICKITGETAGINLYRDIFGRVVFCICRQGRKQIQAIRSSERSRGADHDE